MKKLFTLILSLGLFTALFAQDGRHSDRNSSYGYQQQPVNPYQNNYGHPNDFRGQGNDRQWNDRNQGYDQHGRNQEFDQRDRNRGYGSSPEMDRRDYGYNRGYDRRMVNRYPVQRKRSLFQIIIGGNSRGW